MMLHRKRIEGTDDIRIIRGTPGGPEDIARVAEDGTIVYPGELGMTLIQSFNACDRMRKELVELRAELARREAKKGQLKTINLDHISRSSDVVRTTVRLEDYDLRKVLSTEVKLGEREVTYLDNWLEFGEANLTVENRGFLGGRMGHGILDFEHDTPYVVHIGIIGVQFKFTEHQVSFFEAHLTPNPDNIRIYPPDFDPKKVEGAWECEDCDEHHWTLPDGCFTPPVYELAHLVAGKKVTITIGPRWNKLEEE